MENNLKDNDKETINGKKINTRIERKDIMGIPDSVLEKFGTLIDISRIVNNTIFQCEIPNDRPYMTIQESLDNFVSHVEKGSAVNDINSGVELCGIINQKVFINIPEKLNYICFFKRLVYTKKSSDSSYTFDKCKNLIINRINFKLRGYICHLGNITFVGGQPSAGSGHYVYVGIENDKQILYNDSQPLKEVNDDSYIKRGYIYLYKRVRDSVEGVLGGSNTISPKSKPIPISKSTIKVTSNKKPNKRTRTKTRKHANKITHKLKENNSKNKNKKKTRKHIHKNTVITK
jgi:hypothetical protein